MVFRLKQFIAHKFDEEMRFFKGWQKDMKGVGAILPTSGFTARRMASVVNPASGRPVLELGPGTGVITKAILERGVSPSNLVSVEYAEHFVEDLKRKFPGVDVRHGDAFDLRSVLGERHKESFDCVISAVPMLSFPVERRIALLEELLDLIPAGRPVMQITYGALSPIPPQRGRFTVSHYDFVVRNIPPAQLWVYRRAAN
jgi:phosphatidylethanolamine/phosphatidyl-N-methylethanolamine N-methyltransferase